MAKRKRGKNPLPKRAKVGTQVTRYNPKTKKNVVFQKTRPYGKNKNLSWKIVAHK